MAWPPSNMLLIGSSSIPAAHSLDEPALAQNGHAVAIPACPLLRRDHGRKGNKNCLMISLSESGSAAMTSNIEPIAREITRSICCDSQMAETQIDRWVD